MNSSIPSKRPTSQEPRRSKRVAFAFAAVLIGSTLAAGTAASQEGIHIDDQYLSSHDLDPIIVALGATTHDAAQTFHELQATALDEAWSATSEHPEIVGVVSGTATAEDLSDDARGAAGDAALRVISTRLALESSVETLYDDLSLTREAREIADRWQHCMTRRGYTYTDPTELESDLTRPTPSQHNANISALIEARDTCLKAVDLATEHLVLRLIPDWKQQNAAQLSAYRRALDEYAKQ